MAMRVKRGGGGGINLDLAGLFGNLGGSKVEPVEPGQVDFNDSTFDARKDVRFKPSHPILNVLSGGEGSALANQLNTGQVIQDTDAAKKLDYTKKLGEITSAQHLRQAATERFINTTGVTPEQRPDLWEQYAKQYADQLFSLGGAETSEKTEAAKTGITQQQQQRTSLEDTFPYNRAAARLKALTGREQAQIGETEASGQIGRQGTIERLKDLQAGEALADYPTEQTISLGKQANVVMPHGSFNILTGKFSPFPSSLIQSTPQFKAALGITEPVGQVVGYDPVTGQNIIKKSQPAAAQPQTSPSGVTVKPTVGASNNFLSNPLINTINPFETSTPSSGQDVVGMLQQWLRKQRQVPRYNQTSGF